MDYVSQLEIDFSTQSNKNIAEKQEAYLKNQFQLYGLPTPLRKQIQNPFLLKQNLPKKDELAKITIELWNKPQREFQYFGIDLNRKFIKTNEFQDIELYELMITHKSWWDTVDLIAVNLVGNYFKQFPEQIEPITSKWIKSDNKWLQRTCLIYQLKYKDAIDTDILTNFIRELKNSKDFFLKKAIGWILREYSRTNPEWVRNFVTQHKLSSLSQKEALRLIE